MTQFERGSRRGARSCAFSVVSALLVVGCPESGPTGPSLPRAELGVFYGGQVQQLERVAWPTDSPPPTLGFRLTFPGPRAEDVVVHWEVDQPAKNTPGGRLQRMNEVRVSPGQMRLDQPIEVPPAAELGVWNVRVSIGEQLVLDRALRLTSP